MFSLNGKDWRLTGWARHQWSMEKLVETSDSSQPCVQTVPATVPGGVHCDLLRAGIISDWNDDTNFRHLEWVEHREWTLEKNFSLPRGDFDRIRLRFEGLDYSGFVFVNGHEVMRFQGMHIPYEADITAVTLPGANRLCVVFEQPPEVDGQVGYTSKTTVLKSRYNYGWDWMPRMVNIGIFGDVGLLCDRKACLKEVYPSTQTDGRSGQLTLNAEIEFLTNSPVTFQADLYEGDRLVAVCTESVCASDSTTAVCLKMELPSVRLWEVNGRGGQPLYRAEVRLKDADGRLLDQCVKTVGFRILEFRRPEGAPPDSLPYSIYINGSWMPIKGMNWVPPSPFYGSVTEEDYRRLLCPLRDMNVNLLRVWGGALLESDCFYRLCDEMGILVWQEFPQSSSGIDNAPCEESGFIEKISDIARSYVKRRRHHVSLAVWCAGNELYLADFTPVTVDNPNIAALQRVVLELDPERLFLPGSPSGPGAGYSDEMVGQHYHADTHGPWLYLGPTEHYRQFNRDDSLLHSEVGAPACPREETLQRHCSGPLWPPNETNPYWLSRGSWWLQEKELTAWFGSFERPNRGLPAYVKAFRYIQLEALRYAAGAIRRAGQRKAGQIIWIADEPFPNSANTSVLEYDGCPKPAYYKLKNCFAPAMLGLAYDSPVLSGERRLQATVFACCDGTAAFTDIRADIFTMTGHLLYSEVIGDCTVQDSADLAVLDVPATEPMCLVRLTAFAGIPLCEEYIFTAGGKTPFGALLDMPQTSLLLNQADDCIFQLINTGHVAALFIDAIGQTENGRPVTAEGSACCLLPGETVTLCTSAPCRLMTVDAMNCLKENVFEPPRGG